MDPFESYPIGADANVVFNIGRVPGDWNTVLVSPERGQGGSYEVSSYGGLFFQKLCYYVDCSAGLLPVA